ncbi:hypothetical protein Plhal703r1_c11g0058801 [Plasmopara halstedii]
MPHLDIKACLQSRSACLTMFSGTNVGDAFVAIMRAFKYSKCSSRDCSDLSWLQAASFPAASRASS